jgi:pyruvate/2-oxoglutarate dehydrogenase complex dihydrolipoamide acyltransferase (E2) component
MSEPNKPASGPEPERAVQGGIEPAGETAAPTEQLPQVAGTEPSTESDSAPSAASATQPPPGPPYGGPAGHYVFVPAGATVRTRRFGPAFGRFARNRATQLVAAVVVGAVIGGSTVAIVDNATNHNQQVHPVFRQGSPFGNNGRPGFRFNGGFGPGGQGSGG